jgi:hypothetical protein
MIGRKVWQWCSTREALLLVLIPVAAALVASYLLPQVPAYVRADKFRYQSWLSERQVQFKTWTPLLTAIGAFYVRETLWFRVFLALLAFVLLVMLGEQLHTWFGPQAVRQPSSFYDEAEAEALSSSLPYEQAVRQIQQYLQRSVVQAGEQNNTYLYTSRHAWARASTALSILGLLLLVIGLSIQARWGWQQPDIEVLPYKNVAVESESALKLRLLDPQPYSPGTATQAAPTANLQIDDQTVLPIQLGVPVRHRGYRYLWVSKGGPSVQLSAHRTSDPEQPLDLRYYEMQPQKEKALQFTFAYGQESDHQFILSEDKVVGWLRWDQEPSLANEGSLGFYLWMFGEDGQDLGQVSFEPQASEQDMTTLQATFGDVGYRLQVAQYIVLDIAHQPGRWVRWLGGALLALGACGLLVPQRQIWIQASAVGDGTRIKIREKRQGLIQSRNNAPGAWVAQLRASLGTLVSLEHDPSREQGHSLSSNHNHTTHKGHQ